MFHFKEVPVPGEDKINWIIIINKHYTITNARIAVSSIHPVNGAIFATL